MPAIWASSERPLFVRTVWVDGVRHAVLTPDDPVVNPRLRRRARTSKEKSFPTMHQQTESRLDRLNSCFTKLHVVVEKNFPDRDKIPARIARRQSAPPCARMCAEKTGGLLEIYVNDVGKSDEDRKDFQTSEKGEETTAVVSADETVLDYSSGSVGRSLSCLRRHAFSTVMAREQTDGSSDAHWNPLSERVLQWLDLSGRTQDYELEAESEDSSRRTEDDRRWSAVRRRRHHLQQRRESSASVARERIVVQNYKLQKSNCKLDCLAKLADDEARFARRRLPKIKDARTEDETRKGEAAGPRVPSSVSTKSRVLNAEEDDSKDDEGESQDGLLTMWSPPGRLQLHIVMPNFNSVDKRASSLESLVCD